MMSAGMYGLRSFTSMPPSTESHGLVTVLTAVHPGSEQPMTVTVFTPLSYGTDFP